MEEGIGLDIHKGNWELLAPHFARGALFLVATQLDLKTVANAMAKDDTASVTSWLEEKLLRRPSDIEVAAWSENMTEDFAIFLIVQPYVLIQLAQ